MLTHATSRGKHHEQTRHGIRRPSSSQPDPEPAERLDAGSARIFEAQGAKAIATTSAGVLWALGYPDGNLAPARLQAEVAATITRVIRVPLSIDFEAGYSDDPKKVAENIKPILDAGVVGINIEDGQDAPSVLAAKIEAVRAAAEKAGIALWINARCDVYLQQLVDEPKRADESIKRAELYGKAGASSIFLPALNDANDIRTVVKGSPIPTALMAWAGLADSAELQKLGVVRLSSGSGITQVIWNHAARLARAFVEKGESGPMAVDYMAHSELQGLFAERT
ncbi:isocitrate lyase/phosphoenolpyruvate mutase family protein [Burkholderia sp. THE68]|uniref:isocitrate lyase/PEP mutase family protein n=1 Tax=Burkholderia sp. THE68 TaxID=758782 RepID=UPI001E548887|nr:isocitrate lyase/phosphoenolpyruvate mutase family protein [Burkholderia sp. THE68]